MNVIDALNSRYAVRAFKPDPVPKETMLKILTAATKAPSWADAQPWEIFVAGGEPLDRLRQAFIARFEQGITVKPEIAKPIEWPPEIQQRIAENTAHRFSLIGIDRNDEKARQGNSRRNFDFFGAPVVVYLAMDRTLTVWSLFDIGLLAQSIMLAAQEFTVDSIPAVNLVGYPDLIRKELEIPDSLTIVMGIALGYADKDKKTNQVRSLRRPINEVVRFKGL